MVSKIIIDDVRLVYKDLKESLGKVEGTTWLITGAAGFLGGYFVDLLNYCNKNVFGRPCKIICVDNFISSVPKRIEHLRDNKNVEIINADVTKPLELTDRVDYIIHAASIASPTFYRQYPIETIMVNVFGLKNLLDYAKDNGVKSFLFFSTSEIYGDPTKDNIPTPETYNGNVSCTGPRACYDESKRLGETLCVNYYRQHGVPVKIVRPFNVYGPGLRLEDKRVIPDFCSDALHGRKITILSDGSPTRSYCYVKDAITGFMAALLSDHNGEAFNIGNDEKETSVKELAELIGEITGSEIDYGRSRDKDYLNDNPKRRCPDLTKVRTLLNYNPTVSLKEGLARILDWYREEYGL